MREKKDHIVIKYYCRICNKEHAVKLGKNIFEGHDRYPFPHIFLHGDLKNILTTLYINKICKLEA